MLISAAGIFPAKCLSSTPGSIHSSTAGVTLKGEVPVVAKSCLGLVTKLPPVSVPGDGEHVRNQQRAPEHMSDPDSLPCAQLMEGKWTKQGRGDALVSAWHGETRSRLQEKSCLPLRWKEKKPCNTKKKKQLLYVELICDLEVILVSKKHRITGKNIGKICRVDDGSAITGKQHDVIFFTGLVSL